MEEDPTHGEQQDLDVERKGPILDVIDVVDRSVGDRGAAPKIIHLCPTRHARANLVSFQVAGNFGTESLHKEEALRPWADKTHVAPNDVDQLRQLVQAQPPHEPAEMVSLRSTVTGLLEKPPFERIASGRERPPASSCRGHRPVYFAAANGYVETLTFDRTQLAAGNCIAGPALIEEYASTTVVHPGDVLEVDAFGNLIIHIRRAS